MPPLAGTPLGKWGAVANSLLALNTNQAPDSKTAKALRFAQIGLRTYLAVSGHGALLMQIRAAASGVAAADMAAGTFGAGLPDWARGAVVRYMAAQPSGTLQPLSADRFGAVVSQMEPLLRHLEQADKTQPQAAGTPGSELQFELQSLALGGHTLEAVAMNGKLYVAHRVPDGQSLLYEIGGKE